MRIRILKVLLVIAAGLQALIYGLQNIVNAQAGYQAVAYVLSMQDHAVYPDSLIPPVTSPTLVWLAYGSIIFMEILGGTLALVGAARMAMSINGTPAAFHASKRVAMIGLGMMMLVWIGLFLAIGGALFQMWQTELGGGSMDDAFIFAVTSGMIMGLVAQAEPHRADRREEGLNGKPPSGNGSAHQGG